MIGEFKRHGIALQESAFLIEMDIYVMEMLFVFLSDWCFRSFCFLAGMNIDAIIAGCVAGGGGTILLLAGFAFYRRKRGATGASLNVPRQV